MKQRPTSVTMPWEVWDDLRKNAEWGQKHKHRLERVADAARRYRVMARLPQPTDEGIQNLVQTGDELDLALAAFYEPGLSRNGDVAENLIEQMRVCLKAGIVSQRGFVDYVAGLYED